MLREEFVAQRITSSEADENDQIIDETTPGAKPETLSLVRIDLPG